MPLAGGSSDKFRNRHGNLWTIHYMLNVPEERAHSIRFKPPDTEADGFKFLTRWDEHETCHQVKR